jgi:negative regulator of sigma E activity
MRSNTLSRYGLFAAAAIVLVAALSLWIARSNSTGRATQLLSRTYQADNHMSYAALSSVTAMYGGHEMKSTARIVRVPHKLAITYLSGDQKGLQSGYNERWFWRRSNPQAPVKAYAEVTNRPTEMAARRFQLVLQNYRGYVAGREPLEGRTTTVIELRPAKPIDGAQGPIKKLWIDEKSGLTLRTDSFNYQNQLVMRSVLSELDFAPQITPATFTPTSVMQKAADDDSWMAQDAGDNAAMVSRKTGINPPKLGFVPAGFELDGYGVHHCPEERAAPIIAALSRYTDGLNTLTVFAMEADKQTWLGSEGASPAPAQQKEAGKQTNSCAFGPGTMVMGTNNGLRVLAVGDLPETTLRRVLDETRVGRATPPAKTP